MRHPDRSVLQEGSKGPLPEGPCDSQPLARGSMDQAVPLPYPVRGSTVGTSPRHGPPWQHPPCKASTPAVTSVPSPRVTAAVRSRRVGPPP